MTENNILIVDDEPNVAAALRRLLMDDPYIIYSAESAKEGMQILRTHTFKVVISDEKMPGIQGTEFLSMIHRDFPDVIRILLTGHASIDAAMRAINEGGIYRFFTKPWNDSEIRFAVRAASEKYDLEEENRKLLKIIKGQALNLKLLEKHYPGITKLDKDRYGNIILPDMSEAEMSQIVSEIEKELG